MNDLSDYEDDLIECFHRNEPSKLSSIVKKHQAKGIDPALLKATFEKEKGRYEVQTKTSKPEEPKLKDEGEDVKKKLGFYHSDLMANKGVIMPCRENLLLALRWHPTFKDRSFSHSVFERRQTIDGKPLTDGDYLSIAAELSKIWGASVGLETTKEAVKLLMQANRTNPLTDWFNALPEWDKTPRIDTWLSTYLGAEDIPITRTYGSKWLISGVARALKPGSHIEGCLLFYGKQGIGKSRCLRAVSPKPEWFCDTSVNVSDFKGTAEILAGKFIVEFAELDSLNKSETTSMKSFLTQAADTFRAPYAECAETHPRMAIYAGSTNEGQFLKDPSGNRRYWVVSVHRFDYEIFARDMVQLWAEAKDRYKSGASWVLNADELKLCEESNEERLMDDPLMERIAQFITDADQEITNHTLYNVWLSTQKPNRKAVAEAMSRLGWEPFKKDKYTRGYKRIKNLTPPEVS